MNLIPRKKEVTVLPFGSLFDLERDLHDVWTPFSLLRWNETDRLTDAAWSPAIDVHDTKDAVIVKADLPGLRKEDVQITVEDGVLAIRGEKKEESERKENGAIRIERVYGSFHRSVVLPAAVDETKAKARYTNGVLELTLPKKEEAKSKARTIAIE